MLNELRSFLPSYAALFAFSFFCPILYLASPIYVEQIFDRVMYSRNVDTLLVLGSIAAFLLAMYAVLEWVRKKALGRLGNAIDARLSRVMFDVAHRSARGSARAPNIMADFAMVREFLSGNSLAAVFDAFWSPLFIIVMIIVNWLFGVIALVIVAATTILAILNHRLSKADIGHYQKLSIKSQEFGQAVARNSDTVRALGMLPRMRDRWYELHLRMLGWQSAASGRMEIFTSITKFMRASQMALIFTVGTILFMNNEVTLANTFVAMSLMTRGLGPIDQMVTNWKSYSSCLAALARLDEVLRDAEKQPPKMSLPQLGGALAVARLFAFAPGGDKPLLNDVSFSLGEGRVLGVIGASGAGKSCLARTLVGAMPSRSGSIAIGDHDLAHWNEDDLGCHLGYMPQDIELLPGTIAENIARFDPAAATDPDRFIAAAELAGIEDLVRSLPNGYNTAVGLNGHVLSGGQRSRIALARAVYGAPRFVVLDEPNSNLDSLAEQSFLAMIQKLKAAQHHHRHRYPQAQYAQLLRRCPGAEQRHRPGVWPAAIRSSTEFRGQTAPPALTVIAGALESQRA